MSSTTFDTERLNAVYNERDRCVALAAKLALQTGLSAWLDTVSDPLPQFNYAVYIQLPTGQVSWHIHDSELPLFEFLPYAAGSYDKHRSGAKYQRIEAFCNPQEMKHG